MVLHLSHTSLKPTLSKPRKKLCNYTLLPGTSLLALWFHYPTTFTLDKHLTLNSHISTNCKSAFNHLCFSTHRQFSHWWHGQNCCNFTRPVPPPQTMPTHSFKVSLNPISTSYRVQNSLARSILNRHHFESSSGLLLQRHWWPIHLSINFKHATKLSRHYPPSSHPIYLHFYTHSTFPQPSP